MSGAVAGCSGGDDSGTTVSTVDAGNPSETGGGGGSGTVAAGAACKVNGDCQSGLCNPTALVCLAGATAAGGACTSNGQCASDSCNLATLTCTGATTQGDSGPDATDAGGCNVLFDFNGANLNPVTMTPDLASAQLADWPAEAYCQGDIPEAGMADASGCNASYYYLQGISTTSVDTSVGDPNACGNANSLKLEIPFDNFNEQALFQYAFPAPTDLTKYGTTIYARVRVDSGFNPSGSVPGGFILSVKTGTSFVYGSSGYHNVPAPAAGQWQEITVSLIPSPADAVQDAGQPFDPTKVEAIELHFDTGGGPGDAGTAGDIPTAAVFHVDTIGVR